MSGMERNSAGTIQNRAHRTAKFILDLKELATHQGVCLEIEVPPSAFYRQTTFNVQGGFKRPLFLSQVDGLESFRRGMIVELESLKTAATELQAAIESL